MNLGRLRVLDEVARHRTLADAADALSFTPAAVSQQMTRLEAEVGAELLIRTPRGVQLTDAGRTLLTHARRILGEVRAAEAELAAFGDLRGGTLRFGSFPTATQTLAARAVVLYRARHPGMAVRLVDDEPHRNLARLRDRELDLALVFTVDDRPLGLGYDGRLACAEDAVAVEQLFEDRYVLVVPRTHLLRDRLVTVADLQGERLIGRLATLGMATLATACRERGFEPRFNDFYCPDYQGVQALVAAGDGIAVIPGMAAVRSHDGVVVRRVEDLALRRRVLLAHASGSPPASAAAAMAALLRELSAARSTPSAQQIT